MARGAESPVQPGPFLRCQMRAIKVLPILLMLLAAIAAGQTDSSTSNSAQNPPQTQPQNPMQEPAKPTEAEQNKPKLTQFNVEGAQASNEDQTLGEIKLMTRYTELNGDVSRSFRVQGNNNLGEFNLFLDRKFTGIHRIQFLGMYRATDDKSIDPERESLQKASLRIFSPRDEYILGDSLVNYSLLTFNQNIKGLNINHLIGDKWKFGVVGGIFIDRWGSLYKDLVGRPYVATVFGSRLERKLFNPESRIGLNFSSSRDQLGSLPTAANGTSPQPASNIVGSMDARLATKSGFRFAGEFAYSSTDFDTRFVSTGCVAPCDTRTPQPTLNGKQGDYALRLEGSQRWHKLSLRSTYLRYQPNFASVNARQIADLQDFVFRATYELVDWLTLDGTVRRSNNDLRQQLPTERKLWGPEIRFVFHDLGFYRRAVIETGYRQRNTFTDDKTEDRRERIP